MEIEMHAQKLPRTSFTMKTKAQTISTDALVAVALFMIVIIFFISLTSDETSKVRLQDLQQESIKLISAVSGERNQSSSFVIGAKVNELILQNISNLSYSILKDMLGISADFCIHFEDSQGNVINISGNKTGLGSSYVVVGGVACG